MVDRRDKHIPLQSRVRKALRDTCKLHDADGECLACDQRFVAVMNAFSYEVDLLSRHDAIVNMVVRDRIIESKKAARYYLAWKSACQGRKNWRKLYEYAQGKWYILDKQNIGRGYHDLMMAAYRNQVAGLEACLEDRERDLEEIRLVNAQLSQRNGTLTRHDHAHRGQIQELEQIRTTLQDDHVTAWKRVRELEAELADLRLAASEAEGAKARAKEKMMEDRDECLRQVSEMEHEIQALRDKQARMAQQALMFKATYRDLGAAVGITRQGARRRWPSNNSPVRDGA